MDIVMEFVAILIGVVLSIVVPVAIRWIKAARKKERFDLWQILKPYLMMAVAAIILSFAILVLNQDLVDNFKAGILLGFGWESFFASLK
jgi:uncharacterized membrane protein YidH (DUF202 family)